jgi:hypothetical protein
MSKFAPALSGNGRHAYAVAASAPPAYPVVVTLDTNDEWKFNSVNYTIPASGPVGYGGIDALINAIQASTGGSGATLLNNVVAFSKSATDPTRIKATAIVAGVNTQTFATGAAHDGLANLGFANGAALADADPID